MSANSANKAPTAPTERQQRQQSANSANRAPTALKVPFDIINALKWTPVSVLVQFWSASLPTDGANSSKSAILI
jgi:hypothetical protein